MRDASRSADWASRAASDVEVMDVEPGAFWFGAYRNVNVLVWHQGATIDAVRRLDRTNPARTEAHPERLSTVHIITPSAGGPTAEARDAMNEMHHRWGSTVGCGAVVIERGGFMGVAVRSAVTGMMMLAPKHYRVKVSTRSSRRCHGSSTTTRVRPVWTSSRPTCWQCCGSRAPQAGEGAADVCRAASGCACSV